MNQQMLYRSRSDAMVGGVCAGLGRYLAIDPVWIRLFFILLTLGDGIGVLIYIILWVAMPSEERVEGTSWGDEVREAGENLGNVARNPRNTGVLFGGALIIAGMLLLIQQFNIPWLWWFRLDVLWPGLLILGGAVILWRTLKRG